MTNNQFTLQTGPLRLGRLSTLHGQVQTPCIVPMLMQGTLGPVDTHELENAGVQMVAADGLELGVEPGKTVLQASHGLAGFLKWSRPVLTFSGCNLTADKLKKNASRLGFRYQEPITKADKRMDATNAANLQRLLASDLPIAAFQNISYYAPVDDLASAAKVNSDLQAQERAILKATIPAINGGGIKQVRKQAIAAWRSLPMAFVTQLPVDDFAEWQRIVKETFVLLPDDCLRIVMVNNARQLIAALCLGADLLITGLPLTDAVQGLAYTIQGAIRIKEAAYQNDMRELGGHSMAYWHYLHHQGANAATHGLTINNLKCLLQAVNMDIENGNADYQQTNQVLTR